jgi:trimeric autotransporter adhesin
VEADPTAANNTDSETTTVVAPAVWMSTRAKAVSADDGAFVVNGDVTYAITLANGGATTQGDNPGPELSDVLPASLALLSASATAGTIGADLPANTVTWNGSLPPAGSVSLTIHARVKPTVALGSVVVNQGVVHYDADGNGANEATTARSS